MLQPDLIIQGGTLLTLVEGEKPLLHATLLIQGDRIAGVLAPGEERPPFKGVQVLDATDSIVMPGLVNAHGHTAMTLFRGLADDLPLKQWLFEKIFPAEAKHLSEETVYWGALLGCLEMIASGTTTVSDGYFFQDATARAFQKAGLRALIAQGVIDFPAPGVPDPAQNLAVGKAFIERWNHASDLIRPGLFCHSLTTCSDKTLQEAMALSQEFSLPLQVHLSETEEEVEEVIRRSGERPVLHLAHLGLLNESLIGVHAVHLEDEEIELLARNRVGVVHSPESNMKLASGMARVSEMVKKGIVLGLGTDGCASNNNLDLFKEMDTAAKLSKVATLDPVNMGAATVLRMATVWGAKVLGLEKQIGTIEVGKQADIITIDLRKPHLVPLYNPMSTIVYSASGSDVKDVIVNGRVLMKDRTFTALDAEEVMARVREISEKIRC
ncbi:MAG: amidohydrolase [Deltaproteobacteria bacterium]|nr:amidohydrolase [Deltaproteobacteria bacterium]